MVFGSSGGTAGHLIIGRLMVWSTASPVFMSKYPWARYWSLSWPQRSCVWMLAKKHLGVFKKKKKEKVLAWIRVNDAQCTEHCKCLIKGVLCENQAFWHKITVAVWVIQLFLTIVNKVSKLLALYLVLLGHLIVGISSVLLKNVYLTIQSMFRWLFLW